MITLVCGPPCAGKSTYVSECALDGDLVLDHDLIAQRFGSPVSHGHAKKFRSLAENEIRVRVAEIRAGLHPRAWVIRTMPRPALQVAYANRLGGARIVVIDPGIEVCRQRATLRPNPASTLRLVNRWYAVRSNAGVSQ